MFVEELAVLWGLVSSSAGGLSLVSEKFLQRSFCNLGENGGRRPRSPNPLQGPPMEARGCAAGDVVDGGTKLGLLQALEALPA